jgi:hypothetical protein
MPEENTPLDFHELQRELHEFGARVIGVDIRLDSGELIARLEGEYNGLHSDDDDPADVWFELGGKQPPDREGIMLIVASWGAIHIPAHQFVAARRQWGASGRSSSRSRPMSACGSTCGQRCRHASSGPRSTTTIGNRRFLGTRSPDTPLLRWAKTPYR